MDNGAIVLSLIAALASGNVWMLIGWMNSRGKEGFSLKKMLKTEIIAIAAVILGIALNVGPEQGLQFFMLYGGMPHVDKFVAMILKSIGYTGNGDSGKPPA